MNSTAKYIVSAGGSGWGVWEVKSGKKVAGFTARKIGRYEALCYLYYLNGWNWKKSKYVRENPYLASIENEIIHS